MTSSTSIILDIETLSRRPDAIITEIGLIAFDRSTLEPVEDLSITPSLWDQMAADRHHEAATLNFHRDNGTLPALTDYSSSKVAVHLLHAFFKRFSPAHVWIQGPDFDRPVIENFCIQNGDVLPWDYWRTRDCRTLWNLAFPGVKHPKRPHHAVEDCRSTLLDMASAFKALTLNTAEVA